MSFGTYAPAAYVHPDRYGSKKTQGPNLWVVLHTSEGGETTSSPEQLISFMGRPGDRPNGDGSFYGSSYQMVFDTDILRPAVPYDTVAYSAGGGNARGIHGCFPGKAGQTREQWLDENSRAMIKQCARWIIDVCAREMIPITFIGPVEVARYEAGICDHKAISLAFKKSDHGDVGPGFPWDILAKEISDLLQATPPPPPPPPPVQGVPDVFYPIIPFRNSDTRFYGGSGVNPGEYQFGLNPDVFPADATAVAVTVTVLGADAGYCTIWPSGPKPNASVANYNPGETANGAIVVGVAGLAGFKIAVTGKAHLIIDISGYWTA